MKSENIIDADFGVGERRAQPTPPKKWRRIWINKKLLYVAFLIEAVIVCAVLFANWQFAERYSGHDRLGWWMAIICGVSYAAVEVARVPLAMTAAAHRRRFVRIIAVLTLLFAVVITTKSLSQVGEQMFSQRLVEVRNAQTAVELAEANNGGAIKNDAAKQERIKALDAEIVRLTEALKQFGPPPKAQPIYEVRSGKRYIARWVTPTWSGATMQKELLDARARRNGMDGETEETGKKRDDATAAIAAAKGAYDVAVMESQLHSFAGMLFMKASSKVTDDEVATIKLILVFLGAFAGAVTATGLAYCCFTRYPSTDEPDFATKQKPTQTVEIVPALRDLHNDLKLGKAA